MKENQWNGHEIIAKEQCFKNIFRSTHVNWMSLQKRNEVAV